MDEIKTHWKTQFNYDYLGTYSLPDGKDVILTIQSACRQDVIGNDGKKEKLLVCHFKENAKPMIINRTNCKTITKVIGSPYLEDWTNRLIQVGAVSVKAFGDVVDALRIRPFAPKVVHSDKLTVVTGSPIWNGIIKLIQQGRKVEEAQTKYTFTKEQVKELVQIQESNKNSNKNNDENKSSN